MTDKADATTQSESRGHSALDDMTPEERMASLREFAESKKYTNPAEDGSMSNTTGAFIGTPALYTGPIDHSKHLWVAPESSVRGAPIVTDEQDKHGDSHHAGDETKERRGSFMDRLKHAVHKDK